MEPKVDTSDEACAVACMLVSNPQGALRKDGDGWQKRVNDVIRALRDERNQMRNLLASAVADYESNEGRINEEKRPLHWTVRARPYLAVKNTDR